MGLLESTVEKIESLDRGVFAQVEALLDKKTKPRKSLGRLESLAAQFCAARKNVNPESPRKTIVVMAGDHGVVEQGVSAYPSEVTLQMLLNFASGGAGINVLAAGCGADVLVVDMGVLGLAEIKGVKNLSLGSGTKDFSKVPAMSVEVARKAVESGIGVAQELVSAGANLIGTGDMGIGNTTSASALISVFCGEQPSTVTGRGTGIDDKTLEKKISIIQNAISLHKPRLQDPLDVLCKIGGFEIGGLAGLILGASSAGIPVIVDGLISASAALVAQAIEPRSAEYMIPSHKSVEIGHIVALKKLGLSPLFDLEMRLGEGTGAALAMYLVDQSLAILKNMATFEDAGVSDSGA